MGARGRFFDEKELACRHCGVNGAKQELADGLDEMRVELGRPVHLTSAYRCPVHDADPKVKGGGRHPTGLAADVEVKGGRARFLVVQAALHAGFTGIGIAENFVHVDKVSAAAGYVVPCIWLYPPKE